VTVLKTFAINSQSTSSARRPSMISFDNSAELTGNLLRPFREYYDKFSHVKNRRLSEAVRIAESLDEEICLMKSTSGVETRSSLKFTSNNSKTLHE
jgi:hypothetical protein